MSGAEWHPYVRTVRLRLGQTVNLGNYESRRIDVEVEVTPSSGQALDPEGYIRSVHRWLGFILRDLVREARPRDRPLPPHLRKVEEELTGLIGTRPGDDKEG